MRLSVKWHSNFKGISRLHIIILALVSAMLLSLTGCMVHSADFSDGLESGWELTEYSCDSGNVGLFYSLKDLENGKLILVDSGNPENAEKVRGVIDDNGGHVDAWFLTHYHNDHIGAFNEVYEEYKDQIDRIFVNGKTAERYYKKYTEKAIGRDAICLPSTSPANAAWSLDRLIEAWRIIREWK